MNKNPEHDLQKRCVSWFRYQYPYLRPLFFSVPNGGLRSKKTAADMKAEGQNRGVADLILLLPNIESHSLNIEMKAGSSQSEFQKTYMAWCGISGNKYVICRSFEQFKDIVTQYLSLADKNVIDSLNKAYRLAEAMKLEKAKQEYQKLVKRNNNEN